MTEQPASDHAGVGDLVARITRQSEGDRGSGSEDGGASRRDRPPVDRAKALANDLGRVARGLTASARAAGRRAVVGGSWLVEVLVDTVPRVPVRDAATLRAQHPGLSDDDVAQLLISGAAKVTGAIGLAGGALAAVELAAPPTLLSIPAQLAAETLLVAAVEVKLIAELHEIYGLPATGSATTRAQAYLVSWSQRRGIDPLAPGALRVALGGPAKAALRRRLVRRGARNLSTLGPLFSGAVAGSVVNHRETRRVGEQVRDDLRRHRAGRTVRGEPVSS